MSPLSILLVLAASGCAAAQAPTDASPDGTPLGIRSEPLPPPAPQGLPEAEEADAALSAGTSTALIQFLARHPGDPNASRVRAALAARSQSDAPGESAVAGGEAGIVAAFDAARLADTPDAWDAFAARYKGHPLAVEAEVWRR